MLLKFDPGLMEKAIVFSECLAPLRVSAKIDEICAYLVLLFLNVGQITTRYLKVIILIWH